jgi:peroxin-19
MLFLFIIIINKKHAGNKCDFVDMSEIPPPSTPTTTTTDETKSLDNLLDDALTDFNKTSTSTTKKETVVNSSETAPPPSDPLQSTFEAMCFNDEKFLNELDSLPNILSNFPFGLGETTNENEADSNIFNLFSQLGKHADLLQKIKDEDIEKALEKLADQPDTASASASASNQTTTDEPHVEQLNLFMSSILSKDVMLPACQAVDESYEEWLVKNKDNLTEEEIQRYTKQHQCVKDICKEYETTSNDGQQISRVLQKFQQLQTFGDPPKELLFFPGLPGFGGFGGGDQNLFGDAFAQADQTGQNETDCCLM